MKIGLLAGGASPEREVSIESSKYIYEALLELGHEVFLADPALGEDQPENAEMYFADPEKNGISEKNYNKAVDLMVNNGVELVFNGLHGEFGEDGRIQALLELSGLPYTGAGVLSSAIAMDKAASKIMFRHFGVNTPEWLLIHSNDYNLSVLLEDIKSRIGYPCIIKPNNQGSTIGLTLCEEESQVEEALKLAGEYSDKIIIEEYITGAEIAVGILGDLELPLCRIIPKHKLYDYECKYTDGMSEYEVPAAIDEKTTAMLKQYARLAYSAVECESYGRVDFLLRNSDNKAYCLEVNTLPGLTSHSLLPKMARHAGISFTRMVDLIIRNSNESKY